VWEKRVEIHTHCAFTGVPNKGGGIQISQAHMRKYVTKLTSFSLKLSMDVTKDSYSFISVFNGAEMAVLQSIKTG